MTGRRTEGEWTITRRDLLKCSGLLIGQLCGAAGPVFADRPRRKTILKFGLVTDAHYADADARGTRFYRESLAKMAECVGLMNKRKVNFLVELGDFKDQARRPKPEGTIEHLRAIEKVFAQFKGSRYHVLGNHDADSISKGQFLANVESTNVPRGSKHYSFDVKGLHFVVLDANYRADGRDYDSGNFNWTDANVPKAQLDWLSRDLAGAASPVIVFVHQQLDGKGPHTVKNAPAVRRVLAGSGRVLAVFQGHNHAGSYSLVEGIHYYTLKAMIEGSGEKSNSYAVVEVDERFDIAVTGYRKALAKALPKAPPAKPPAKAAKRPAE